MAGLPPPPVDDDPGSFTWLEWYRQLRAYVSTSGSVPWYIIDFANSNITDIAARSHQNLQSLQGGNAGERYHLTAAQYAAIGSGSHNSLAGLQGGTAGQYYHLTNQEHNQINNYIDVLNTTSSIVLPTTPTVIVAPTINYSNGIQYNTTTGVFTFTNGGVYTFHSTVNATPSAANKSVYFYAEEDTGSGWVIKRYSARIQELTNAYEEQLTFDSTIYAVPGMKTRHFIWADATVTLNSVDIPGTTPGTVTVPAYRTNWGGGI